MKKILLALIIVIATPALAFAQSKYVPLIDIPLLTQAGDTGFSGYINFLYSLSIGIAGLLAVIKIIVAGVKYMFSDVITNKAAAKGEIKGALLGLLLILGAYLILNTINPQLVTGKPNFKALPPAPNIQKRPPPITVAGTAANGSAGTSQSACGVAITSDATNNYTTANLGSCNNADRATLIQTITADCRKLQGTLKTSQASVTCTVAKTAPPPTVIATGLVPGSVDSKTCSPTISQKTSGIYTIYSQNLTGCAQNNASTYHQSLVTQCNPPGEPTRTTVTGTFVNSSCSIATAKIK